MTRSLLLVVLALTVLAGCGGGSDSSTDDFVADANRICREGEAKIEEVAREQQEAAGDLESLEQQREAVATTLERTAEAYAPYMERLRALDPPSDLDENWTSFLDGVERAFDLIPDLADATRAADQQRLTELSEEFTQIARETRPFAEDNRLDDCLPDQGN
jgi:outer membrane murein-binding lipoprotein Lpp